MTENEGDPVWLSVTQPRPTPMLYACPTPIPPVCCSQGCCLAGGQGTSTPFASNKEPGSSLGRWTALSTWGISVPKNMPCACQNPLQKSFLLNFCRIGQLRASFGQDTIHVKQLQLVGTVSNKLKGQKAAREFLQIMSDEQGLAREAVRRTPR